MSCTLSKLCCLNQEDINNSKNKINIENNIILYTRTYNANNNNNMRRK